MPFAGFGLGCVWEMRKGAGQDGIFGNVPKQEWEKGAPPHLGFGTGMGN